MTEKALIGWVIFHREIKEYYATNSGEWFYTPEIRKAEFFELYEDALDTVKHETLRESQHDIIEMELVWCAKPAEKLQLNLDGL